jgi:hypothetical protein
MKPELLQIHQKIPIKNARFEATKPLEQRNAFN